MTDQGSGGGEPQSGVGGEGAPQAAAAAKEHAKEAATTAVAKTADVASTATEGARDVASEATRQASQLTKEAAAQARNLASETTGQLRDHAGQQTERAASGLRSLSEQVRALSDGRPDEAGAAGDYVRQAGDKLQQVAGRLEEGGLDGVVRDLQGFARRQPGLFLLGAAGAGFVAGRVLRGAQAANNDGDGQPGPSSEEPALRLGRAGGPLGDAPPSVGAGGDVVAGTPDIVSMASPAGAPPPRSGAL